MSTPPSPHTQSPTPPRSISDKLSEARRRRMVGRSAELALFQEALQSAPEAMPFSVLSVFGPGGVGKSTLLRAYADLCRSAGVPCHLVNGRDVESSPDRFLKALGGSLGLETGTNVIAALAGAEGRQVILLDTFEALESLEGWLRDAFLPQLSGETLVVVAGRNPLSTAWRGDEAWQPYLRSLSLRNLSPQESRLLLDDRAIPAEHQEAILEFTHGYPLALSLMSDLLAQRATAASGGVLPAGPMGEMGPSPDIVQALLERFVDKTPTPLHRAALEVCALLRVTTEPVLARLLDAPDVRDLFDWLRGLSFIEPDQPGISPHGVARDTLMADLRWRSPDRYADLHRRARAYYQERLAQTTGGEQQRILWDYIFLHRDNGVVRQAFTWQDTASVYPAPARPEDRETLAAWVEQFEGTESAGIFRYWWDRPEAQMTLVFRQPLPGGGGSEAMGFMMQVAVHKAGEAGRAADPATDAALRFLENNVPLRSGEAATTFRFWMAKETYHSVSAIQSLIIVNTIRHYLTTPGLAYSFFPVLDPDHWLPAFTYAEMVRVPDADYVIGSKQNAVFGHDWRTQPPTAWLAALAEKEIAGQKAAIAAAAAASGNSAPPTPPVRRAAADSLVVLSDSDFAAAVREALRGMTRPESLTQNPLLRSRVVAEQVGASLAAPVRERANALCRLLLKTAQGLEGAGRHDRAYKALYHTYLRPAPTQERAAEILDLPFSTYRRHLAEGIVLLTDALWQQEIGAANK
ncbi:MAG: ATP-binding protein [Cytophagales bacterium]|nr:ATP-binding protein [Armatimonadota bacterium]